MLRPAASAALLAALAARRGEGMVNVRFYSEAG